jgi:5-methylthioadenosine/S-adenosylhomocysteine deaminase
VSDDDITKIKASGASVVHCPRSNLRLHCGRMPLEKYLAQGVPVFLGTDSLGSSPSLDVFDELDVAAALHHGKVEPGAIGKLVHTAMPGENTKIEQ